MMVPIVLGILVSGPLLGLLLWCCVRQFLKECQLEREHRDKHEEYLRTHPPLSDEDYLKLCPHDVRPEVALKVRQILAEVSGLDREIIYPDARLVDDLMLY